MPWRSYVIGITLTALLTVGYVLVVSILVERCS